MGDVAMTVPVVRALRAGMPDDVRITVLTRPFFQPFFRDIEGLEFLPLNLNGRHKGLRGLFRLASDARAAGVDTVADLHDVLRSRIVTALLRLRGCRTATIDKGRADKRALTRKFRKYMTQLRPMVERYRDVFAHLGLELPEPQPFARDPRPMPEAVTALCGEKRGVWVGVAPFAKHEGKTYPLDMADSVIGELAERYERVFIFGGGRYEQEFAENAERKYDRVISVVGRVKLTQEMDVISNLDVIVTMDSSAMHMASLAGVPAVSIWGATHPFAGFYGYGQAPENAVQLELECRPCSVFGNKPCMHGDYRCMRGISPASVVERVGEVLARGAAK